MQYKATVYANDRLFPEPIPHPLQQLAPCSDRGSPYPELWRLTLHAPELVSLLKPGQFLHLLTRPLLSHDPLLRRPISVASWHEEHGTCSLYYQVVGRGTAYLSQLQAMERLDLLGPLGQPYPMPPTGQQSVALVAGGIGIPPLFPLAKTLLQKGHKVTLFLGARTRGQLLMLGEFRQAGVPYFVTTDDGSAGRLGRVVDDFHDKLLHSHHFDYIYTCGPKGMLQAVQTITAAAGLSGWLIMESHMACGLGACLGCTIRVQEGEGWRYALLCQEGVAFAVGEVCFDV
ncbi:MAG: dihydroorotate dehydrogenase electron transfer subunit [Symbiobacteriaceae bacterium]|nr:dihydroorotate dehydrogenase electron transfer subunit [Symbiobacteriaceae bacterium]